MLRKDQFNTLADRLLFGRARKLSLPGGPVPSALQLAARWSEGDLI